MLAHVDDNEQQVTMTARAPSTEQNLFRLFHVLWHCVKEMKNVLDTISGVLDRYIMMKKGLHPTVGHRRTTYCVASVGPQYDVDDLSRIKKALESPASAGIQTGRNIIGIIIASIINHCPLFFSYFQHKCCSSSF